jgi:2-amino-4-hydroxy-6-hydroxymethyldihydropteridine diphosphokinase
MLYFHQFAAGSEVKISTRIAFGLGSNIGNRANYLRQAVQHLCALQGLDSSEFQQSSIIETPAILPEGAPLDWDIAFFNQILVMRLHEPFISNPELLLQAIKIIEADLGRIQRGHWSPREIDIDIIAIEGLEWQSETLQIPHKHAHLRHFVLQPLCEIWADAILANGLSAYQNMVVLDAAMQQSWSQIC